MLNLYRDAFFRVGLRTNVGKTKSMRRVVGREIPAIRHSSARLAVKEFQAINGSIDYHRDGMTAKEFQAMKVTCERCNATVRRSNIKRHQQTKACTDTWKEMQSTAKAPISSTFGGSGSELATTHQNQVEVESVPPVAHITQSTVATAAPQASSPRNNGTTGSFIKLKKSEQLNNVGLNVNNEGISPTKMLDETTQNSATANSFISVSGETSVTAIDEENPHNDLLKLKEHLLFLTVQEAKKRALGADIANHSTIPVPVPSISSGTKSQKRLAKSDNKKMIPYEPIFGRTATSRTEFVMTLHVVNTEAKLTLACRKLVKVPSIEVTLHCEGTLSKLFAIVVATKQDLFIFDCVALDAQIICEALKPLLDHKGILKLTHDSHNTAALLKKFGNINEIHGVFDTQLLMEVRTSKWDAGFKEMLNECSVGDAHNTYSQLCKLTSWERQPALDKKLREFLKVFLDDARKMHEAYGRQLEKMFNEKSFAQILNASFARVQYAAATGGERNICFCAHNEYRIQSYEYMQEIAPSYMLKPAPTVVSNDSASLIELLPEDLATWVRDKGDNLFEIVLDKGRTPTAWIGQERVMIDGNNANRLVTKDDIAHVTTKLGQFGSDNRAGLERQLHRISAIRNRSNDIIGLTMRVGRHVSGNAYIITDLLYRYPKKSILFLGEPGSGKTTVVREVTRLLADCNNVCIVDTSNEIAGDGDIPHPCVGHARRMMLPNVDMQSDVMVECVQNHTPKVIVIDEIGRSSEVDAARTCKNRGVRLIASAHGDLRQLVKNPKLRGLIGGIDRVTIGDEEARKIAKERQEKEMQKTKTERAGPPAFEIIVELKRGAHHEWTIIFDVGEAVDKILEGRKYPIQRRTRNPKTGAINIVLDEA